MERHRRQQYEKDDGMRHLPVVFVVDATLFRLSLVEFHVTLDDEHGNRCAQPNLEPFVRNVRTAQDGVVDPKLVQAPDGGAHYRRALHLVIRMVGRESPDGLHRRTAIGIPLLLPPVVQEAGRLHVGVAHLESCFALLCFVRVVYVVTRAGLARDVL